MAQPIVAERPMARSGAAAPPTVGRPATVDAAGISKELARLGSSANGLATAEAQSRLQKFGPNAIQAHEESRWHKLLGYFWGPIPWMIEAAALISLARRDWADFVVVGGLLLYNAAVGFWQDNKAANALVALKQGLALKARVRRDGAWTTIDATSWCRAMWSASAAARSSLPTCCCWRASISRWTRRR
jgi:H+-transporting ATPase